MNALSGIARPDIFGIAPSFFEIRSSNGTKSLLLSALSLRIPVPHKIPTATWVRKYRDDPAYTSYVPARALYFPQISLTGFMGGQSRSLSNLFTGPARLWALSPHVTLTIFNAGRLRSNVKATEAGAAGIAGAIRQDDSNRIS